jgi:hypothetical protein
MSSNSNISQIHEQTAYACAEAGCATFAQETLAVSEHSLFTHQTGHLLETLGNIFIHVAPFNDFIGQNTGELLVSVGRKLKIQKYSRLPRRNGVNPAIPNKANIGLVESLRKGETYERNLQ